MCSQWGVIPIAAVCCPLAIVCRQVVRQVSVARWSTFQLPGKKHSWRVTWLHSPDVSLQQLGAASR